MEKLISLLMLDFLRLTNSHLQSNGLAVGGSCPSVSALWSGRRSGRIRPFTVGGTVDA